MPAAMLGSLSSRARLFLFCLVCSPLIPSVTPLSFNVESFHKGMRDILYEGVATPAYGYVDLTTRNPPHRYQVGRIKYAKPVCIRDPQTGRQADFRTHFSFTIETGGSAEYSDGLAFFLTPVGIPIPPNSAGQFLGLFDGSTDDEGPQNQIVMVEFDTYVNEAFDPPVRHIGINKNVLKSLVSAPWDPASHSGKATDVLVTYNSTTKNLSVSWSFDNKPLSQDKTYPSISYPIDLAEVLPEYVAIGFSASFGLHPERHSINSWNFTSNLDVVDPPPLDRSRPKGVNSKPHRSRILVVVAVAFFLLVISAGSGSFLVKKSEKHGYGALTDIEISTLPAKFTYQELLAATNGFAEDRRLGRGGSGQVYKGFLSNSDRLVAVKRIFAESRHSEKVFANEVKIISRTIHRNLVPFVGWCQEEGEFLLVYKYMPNGSLDHHLFGARRCLPWDVRYSVALGLASALNYLHEELEQWVLHRDIKAANVLLDTNFSTKLGDFGVAKLVDPRFRTPTTDVVGTFGYLAPEYLFEGRATKESDMFSFGVVALEIACGQRSYEDGGIRVPLHKWVWQLYLAGNILTAADEALCSGFRREEVECLMMVGLWCVHPDPARRPKAGQAIRFLRLEDPVPELPRGALDGPLSYRPSASQLGTTESPSPPIQESVSIKQDKSCLLKSSRNTC
ncbi:L-type lectin-domain containing receptor kinase IX.1-like [Rhodamnia argentea]|uniref:L-type lectin-domain containing receptor kinase IX.1-like n=1 Tax=Rhodamnia argentea TaxID=178133 RepID=A0A8B8PGJ5_9MYRT|nr:L-type lectin-domain containing receptor kinase IX.1-like [Rhodamnia argentea]